MLAKKDYTYTLTLTEAEVNTLMDEMATTRVGSGSIMHRIADLLQAV